MTTPIDKMIKDTVRCVVCGAGFGKCDCWWNCPRCGWSVRKGEKCDSPKCGGAGKLEIVATRGDIEPQRVPFGDRLSGLCAMELAASKGNAERAGEMIERLLNSLAFTIAIAAQGDPKVMDDMLKGAESYLYEAASGHQEIGQFMGTVRR